MSPQPSASVLPVKPATRRPGRLQGLITLMASLAFASNGIGLATLSFALPGMRREWGLSPPELGLVAAGASGGQVCGSLLIGWLADRFGRRIFAVTIALAAVATGLVGLAPNALVATLLFFVAGVGISGVAPVATSLIGEFAGPKARGPAMAWTQVFWVIGWCLTAAGGAVLTAGGSGGWRFVLALGLTPIVLAVLSWKMTPESPRFLLAHGRRAEAIALVEVLEARYGVRLPLPEQQRANRRATPLDNLRELWRPAFRRRTLTLWLTWFVMVGCFSGPIVWLPTLLAARGGSDALATRGGLISGLFMVPASFLSVLLIERAGRRRLLMASLLVGALGALGLALADSELAVILAGGALSGGVLAAWPIVLGYTAELYPTRFRATAAGWAGAVARSGGIVAPLLLGALISSWGDGLTLALGVFAALLVLVVALVAFQGEETRGRTLEELSG